MRNKSWRGWLILLVLLFVPRLARSQAVQQSRTLILNGQSGQVKIMEVDGRSYVDLESLARIVNGTLRFSSNQITLTLPSSAAGTEAAAAPSGLPANSGFSREFLRASIEEMAVIREWRSALVNSIEKQFPDPGRLGGALPRPGRRQPRIGVRGRLRRFGSKRSSVAEQRVRQHESAERSALGRAQDHAVRFSRTSQRRSPEPEDPDLRSLPRLDGRGGPVVDDVSCH